MIRYWAGALLLCSTAALAEIGQDQPLRDAYFGEAFFYAHQGDYFSALQRMDAELLQHYGLDEPVRDSLHYHLGAAEFSVGDFELSYRMHHRAGRAITAVLEGNVDERVRNEAAFRLARIHFQKGQMPDALLALDRMTGKADPTVLESAAFLRSNVYLATGRFVDAAEILRELQKAESVRGFAAYNLGVALWRAGEKNAAFAQLTNAGTMNAHDAPDYAIKDKANLVLGNVLLEEGASDAAMSAFQRVRLEGPFADQALLGAGWAHATAGRFDRAVVAWKVLAERNGTQASVQDAKLALPYAYGELNVHGRAALMYRAALDSFSGELDKLNASIESIEAGRFLAALVHEEIRHNLDWVVRLRELPESPETYYLTDLLASHEFQNALQNYLDLEHLRATMRGWQTSFTAYEDLLRARREYYEPLLPVVDDSFRALDSRMRLRQQQAQLIERRLRELLTRPQPEVLATADERAMHDKLLQMAVQLEDRDDAGAALQRQRVARLQGVLTWRLYTQYHQRFSELYQHAIELQRALDTLNETHDSYVRVRQAAAHGYQGFGRSLARLEQRVKVALPEVEQLMRRQGSMLEQVAIAELRRRRSRLEEFQNVARYAMADSYDRATKLLQEAGR